MRRRSIRVLIICITIYVALYFVLSRLSLRINAKMGVQGFFYVPVSATDMQLATLQRLHEVGNIVFYPAWLVDYKILGGPVVSAIPLFNLDNSNTNGLATPSIKCCAHQIAAVKDTQ